MSTRRHEAEPETAPGDFYVQRDQCIICMLPCDTAPGIFGFHDTSLATGVHTGSHCYVARQPATPAELDLTIEALAGSCCGAVRYAGRNPEIIVRIKAKGAAQSCDHRPMNQLTTRLPVQECLDVLREQVSPLTFFARNNILKPKTSKVLGRIWDDGRFILESSFDPFSKRLVGQFTSSGGEHTIIEYTWKRGLRHRLYGSPRFDEEEILSFLEEWLEARSVNGLSPGVPASVIPITKI